MLKAGKISSVMSSSKPPAKEGWKGRFLDSGFSLCTTPTFYHSPGILKVSEIQKKKERKKKEKEKMFLEGGKVWKGLGRVSGCFEWIQEVKSLEKGQEVLGQVSECWKDRKVSGKFQQVLEGGYRKHQESQGSSENLGTQKSGRSRKVAKEIIVE